MPAIELYSTVTLTQAAPARRDCWWGPDSLYMTDSDPADFFDGALDEESAPDDLLIPAGAIGTLIERYGETQGTVEIITPRGHYTLDIELALLDGV
jgi:hypothetical protein